MRAAACLGLVMLAASGCASSAPDAIAQRLTQCGLLSPGSVPPYLIDSRFYAPNDCYRDCIASASCEELHQRLCGTGITLPVRCDERCAYHCPEGGLVEPDARCNGYTQCPNGSDEEGCPTFLCSDGTTLPLASRCDGYPQCPGGSDERDCPGACTTTSGYTLILARAPYAICNGYRDCVGGEDEAGCATLVCTSGMHVTYDPTRSIVCDGVVQCWSDREPADEAGCPAPATFAFTCP